MLGTDRSEEEEHGSGGRQKGACFSSSVLLCLVVAIDRSMPLLSSPLRFSAFTLVKEKEKETEQHRVNQIKISTLNYIEIHT